MSRALLVLALLCSQAALAQTVYRCGADGQRYEQEPCADGRAVGTADKRSAQQVAQAREMARREARMADELERARLQNERQAMRQKAASLGPASKPRDETARCAQAAGCTRDGAKQRQRKQPEVTLYRAPEAR